MEIDPNRVQELVNNPGESLSREVKRWIDPTTPEDQAKIIRGTFALYNRNGGELIIGFDNNTFQPDKSAVPTNVRKLFHVDYLQGIISRYASRPFEIAVVYGSRGGQEYPVIVVPLGVMVPVAAKNDLYDNHILPKKRKFLVRKGDIYFRSLHANGIVSSTIARPEDWEMIVEICADNREANIGRFFRRQLSGLNAGTLSELSAVFSGMVAPPAPSSQELVTALLQEGDERFAEAVTDRRLDERAKEVLNWGMFDAGILVQGKVPDHKANGAFRDLIYGAYPNYVYDMPIILDTRYYQIEQTRPRVIKKGWESLIFATAPNNVLDIIQFIRLDPGGKFYVKKMLDDDIFAGHNNFAPLSALDPYRQIANVADAISAGLAFARAMGCDPQATTVEFGIRWTKLKNRRIHAWTSPVGRAIGPRQYTAHEDVITNFIRVPLETARTAIAPFVHSAIEDLLINFGIETGEIGPAYVEEFVRALTKSK